MILADRYYPSSKTCLSCGVSAKLKRERRWQCGSCSTIHERNYNAAVNLRNFLTLPLGRGVTLRDGKALAMARGHRETGPDDRRTAPPEIHSGNADCVLTSRHYLNVNTP